jgi:4-hydroxy-tetrahydrodipicolinate synthase
MIPAMKAAVAHYASSPGWVRVRPPLDPFTEEQSKPLIGMLEKNGFTMDGLSS